VTALTYESADWIKTHTSARRVPVIPNAVLWPLPLQEPRINPDSLCQSERSLLLAVGRIDIHKGFDWLLDAFMKLAQKHPDWDLVILGEGPQRLTLQARVQAARLEKRVFLPGRAGNVAEWYKRAQCYVMSSRLEGFPNTLAEAMAHGLPAVSFDCDTGPRDIIRHEIDGLLVPSGDLVGLIGALDCLMRDSSLRQQFAARAVDIRERFSMEKITRMWEILFNEVLRDR